MIGRMKNGASVMWRDPDGLYVCCCRCGRSFKRTRNNLATTFNQTNSVLRCRECYKAAQRKAAITNGTILRKGL